jgi:hypothetical protein
MTEAEWLACDDPGQMLRFLHGKASGRKLRRFAVACVRRVRHLLTDERSRRAVEVAERYADGMADGEDVRLAAIGAETVADAAAASSTTAAQEAAASAAFAALNATALRAETAADYAAANAGSAAYHAATAANAPSAARARAAERAGQSRLLRDLFGPLAFRPVVIAPALLAWNDGAVRNMAQAIYDERAFDRLPILADALEDSGCTSEELLSHCRAAGGHVRGCWAVDLLLGQE